MWRKKTKENVENKNWFATMPDWNWVTDWKIPEFNEVQSSVIEFNVNRLADVLEMSTKTLKQRKEFKDRNVTITSMINFGPIRLSVSVNECGSTKFTNVVSNNIKKT